MHLVGYEKPIRGHASSGYCIRAYLFRTEVKTLSANYVPREKKKKTYK